MTILEKILAEKRREVSERRRSVPIEALREEAGRAAPPRGFRSALESPGGPEAGGGDSPARHLEGTPGRRGGDDRRRGAAPRIIAEVKKASPSRGVIREDFDPVAIARAYELAGAAAISVLTDRPFFQGSLESLRAIRGVVSIPLLRKDFLIDPYQVWEARAAGADAILLILAALPDDSEIESLARQAEALGMEILWEVHDREELRRALALRPGIIGINNRNLRTFEVSLETTRSLLEDIPPGVLTVSESGFFRRDEIDRMIGWGVDAFLIGESLIRAPDPGAALSELLGATGEGTP